MIFRRKRPPRLGLALGGGGARGGIHVGVLKVLDEAGVPVSFVAGTSIGALVGAFYALSLSGKKLEERLKSYLSSDTFRRARFNLMAQADGLKDAPFFHPHSLLHQEGVSPGHGPYQAPFDPKRAVH